VNSTGEYVGSSGVGGVAWATRVGSGAGTTVDAQAAMEGGVRTVHMSKGWDAQAAMEGGVRTVHMSKGWDAAGADSALLAQQSKGRGTGNDAGVGTPQ